VWLVVLFIMIGVNVVLAVSLGLAVQLGHAIGCYHVAMLFNHIVCALLLHVWQCHLAIWQCHLAMPLGGVVWLHHWAVQLIVWQCHWPYCWAVLFGCIIGWCCMSFGSGIWPCYCLLFSSTAKGGSKKKPPAGDGATSLVEFVCLTSLSVDIDDAAVATRKC